jgi:tripartite-type tricarboxylate transporter receptor subunit TctC
MKWHSALLLRALALFAAAFPFANAMAQATYPEKTVRIIVPFPAGGATDILARLIAERLAGAFGKPVVVENVSGAAGATGTGAAAKAPPDGHTLLTAVATTTTLLPHLRGDLPYNPLRDFEAVTLIASFPNLLVVRPAVAANDVRQLINLVRANPGKYSYASSGFGGSPHLSAEWFKHVTKTDILHVPFAGSAPALPALLGGHVDLMFDTMPSVLPLVLEGKLRALGVTTAERVPFLPNIPAIAETLPDFDVTSWLGIMVPAGTPAEIRARIAAPLTEFIREPAVVQRLRDLGAVAARPNAPEEYAAWIRKDYEKWGRVIRETGIKLGN